MEWLTFFKYAGYAILIFGAFVTVGTSILQERNDAKSTAQKDSAINKISSDLTATRQMLEPFVDLAKKHFPNMSDHDALDSLSQRIDLIDIELKNRKAENEQISSNLIKEKNTIKTLQAKLSVMITGDWEKGKIPFSLSSQFMSPQTLLQISKEGRTIVFKAMNSKAYAIDDNTAIQEITMNVDPGTYPISSQINEILDLDAINGIFPVSFPSVLHSPMINIKQLQLELFINGAKKGEYKQVGSAFNIEQFTKGKPYKDAITPYVPFQVDESVRKAFNIQ